MLNALAPWALLILEKLPLPRLANFQRQQITLLRECLSSNIFKYLQIFYLK